MKRKIGEIYNKPIVTGDKNLLTKNEIHESALGGGNNNEGIKEHYYKFVYNPDVVTDEILIIFIIKEIVCDYGDGTTFKLNKLMGSYGGFVNLEEQLDEYCKYIITLDCPVSVNVQGEVVNFPKGSVAEKCENFINMMYPDAPAEETEALINAINASFILITKEEYEAALKDLGIE